MKLSLNEVHKVYFNVLNLILLSCKKNNFIVVVFLFSVHRATFKTNYCMINYNTYSSQYLVAFRLF